MKNNQRWYLIGNIASIMTISAIVVGINEKILGPIRGNLFLGIIVGFLLIILAWLIPKLRVKIFSISIAIALTFLFIVLFVSTFIAVYSLGELKHTSPTIKLETTPFYTITADPQLGDSLVITFAVEKGKHVSVSPDTLEIPGRKPTCDSQNVSIYSRAKKEDRIALLFKDSKKCKSCVVQLTTDNDVVFISFEYYKRGLMQRGSQWLIRNILYFRY
jgi:energy-coupling factor transporter transmembrane protein EcfT